MKYQHWDWNCGEECEEYAPFEIDASNSEIFTNVMYFL